MNTEILDKILGAAESLFLQYGFKTITMDDIARKAGISKKTLYQHFANKGEVVTESVCWYQSKISKGCITTLNESANAIEGMVRIMAMFDEVLSNTNPTALLELERFFPEGYKRFRENIMQKDVEHVKQNITQGIEEGVYRPEVDADFLAKFRMELSFMMLRPSFFTVSRHSLPKLAKDIAEHFLYGMMTAKGERLYHKYKEQYLKKVPIL